MYRAIKRVYKKIDLIEQYLLGGIFLLLSIVIFYTIVNRAFGGIGLTWLEEFARSILICTTFYAGCVATSEDRLTKLTLIPDMLSKKKAALLRLVTNLASGLFMLWLGIAAVRNTVNIKFLGMETTTLGIQTWVLYLIMTVGILGLALRMLIGTYDYIQQFRAADDRKLSDQDNFEELKEKGE